MSTDQSQNTCIELDVPAVEPLSGEAGAFVLHEIIKHFLFMRSQLPGLFDDIWWQYEGEEAQQPGLEEKDSKAMQRKRRSSGLERKTEKVVKAVCELLECLTPELLSLQQYWCISLLFGPTPQRPYEVYDVILPIQDAAQEQACSLSADSRDQLMQAVARKVVRSLVMAAADITEGKASSSSTKLFVLIRAPIWPEAPAGFLPKRGYAPRMRKGLKVKINLAAKEVKDGAHKKDASSVSASLAGSSEDEQMLDLAALEIAETAEHLWYQCRVAVQGFNLCMSSNTKE